MVKLAFPKYSGEDPTEWLSRVAQFFDFQGTNDNQKVGSLRDYQKNFERLGNRVHGWTQKALVGTFMGGLKSEIADGIRMFKLRTLKEAISLVRMRDKQLARTRRNEEHKDYVSIAIVNSPLDISAKGLNFSFLSANLQNMKWKKKNFGYQITWGIKLNQKSHYMH
uniref:Retrotransposon gag domain-containing protein n=1 Tax=Populus alba TaxID=43335 RepID=A0A4U5R532_POPAL|nr:hypothetical protein D5086_0000006520 [Populus alba]